MHDHTLENWRKRIEQELGDRRSFEDLTWQPAPGVSTGPIHVEAARSDAVPAPSWSIVPVVTDPTVGASPEDFSGDVDAVLFAPPAGSEHDALSAAEKFRSADVDAHVLARRPAAPGALFDPLFDPAAAGLFGTATDSTRRSCIDLRPAREAGAQAVTRIAAALWSMDRILSEATDPDAARVPVFVPVGTGVISDIAELRALRVLLSRIVDAYASASELQTTVDPVLHVISAASSLPAHADSGDDASNLIRATLQAVAAIAGGANRISLLAYDYDRGETVDGIRLSANVLRMMRHESFLDAVRDPMRGSHSLETVTGALMDAAWSRFLSFEPLKSAADLRASQSFRSALEEDRQSASIERVGVDLFVSETAAEVS